MRCGQCRRPDVPGRLACSLQTIPHRPYVRRRPGHPGHGGCRIYRASAPDGSPGPARDACIFHGARCVKRRPDPPPRARRQRRRTDPSHSSSRSSWASSPSSIRRISYRRSTGWTIGTATYRSRTRWVRSLSAASRPPTPLTRDGHRTMPSPASPRGTVVFLGDSFTFGFAVEEDQTYPYVLATEHWADLPNHQRRCRRLGALPSATWR